MHRSITFALQCVVAAVVLVGVGCQQTKEVGKSAKELFLGTLDANVERSPEQVADAIDETIEDLGLLKIGVTTQPAKGEEKETTVVTVRNKADEKVTVNYRPVDEKWTYVSIGTGVLGDSALREQVWDTLRVKLGLLGGATQSTNPTESTEDAPATTEPAEATP